MLAFSHLWCLWYFFIRLTRTFAFQTHSTESTQRTTQKSVRKLNNICMHTSINIYLHMFLLLQRTFEILLCHKLIYDLTHYNLCFLLANIIYGCCCSYFIVTRTQHTYSWENLNKYLINGSHFQVQTELHEKL